MATAGSDPRAAPAAAEACRGAVHTALGLGILGVQRAQVRRRALERWADEARAAAGPALRHWRVAARGVADPVLDAAEGRVPEPARRALRCTRSLANAVGDSVLDLVDPPASSRPA